MCLARLPAERPKGPDVEPWMVEAVDRFWTPGAKLVEFDLSSERISPVSDGGDVNKAWQQWRTPDGRVIGVRVVDVGVGATRWVLWAKDMSA